MDKAIEMLASALDRFTLAYGQRTQCERDRLAFEKERDERYARTTAAKLELDVRREARLAAKGGKA